MAPSPAAMKRAKAKRRSHSDFQYSKKINHRFNLADIHASSTQQRLLDYLEAKDASESNTRNQTMTESTTTPPEQPPFQEQMDLKDISDPNAPESNVTTHTTRSSRLENMDLKAASDSNSPDPNVTDDAVTACAQKTYPEEIAMNYTQRTIDTEDLVKASTKALSSQPSFLEQMGPKSNPDPTAAIATNSTAPSAIENMESKGASDAIAAQSNVPHPTVTGTSAPDSTITENATTLSEQLPLFENKESMSTSNPNALKSNVTKEDTIAPLEQAPTVDAVEFSDVPMPNSMETNTFRITKETIERRRRARQMKDRQREFRIVAYNLAAQFSDQQLHDILRILPSERNEYGEITNMDYVYRFVPHEHKGLPIDDKSAMGILQSAVKMAVCARLENIDSIISLGSDVTKDGYSRITAYWYGGERPTLPDSLMDLSAFIVFKEMEKDPKDIHLDARHKVIPVLPVSLKKTQFSESGFGSVGFIGTYSEGEDVDHHVVVTAGHIFDETTSDEVHIATITNNLPVVSEELPEPTKLMHQFQRKGRKLPRFRKLAPRRECMDEICLIDGEPLPQLQIQHLHLSDPVHCSAFYPIPEDEDPLVAAQDPILLDGEKVVLALKQRIPFKVFKRGVQTGLTMGTLLEIVPSDKLSEKMNSRGNLAVAAYYLKIKWVSDEKPFAVSGDSGSLVYARHDGMIVPLGIHYGSEENESYAWLLWSWCREIYETLNAELVFCVYPECPYAAK